MKKIIIILCLGLFFMSCNKDDEPKRELIISANGILAGGKRVNLSESSGVSKHGYSVYLHKGTIEITEEVLKDPSLGAFSVSRGIFFKVIDDGEYTIIVDVSYLYDGAFGSSHYSGKAYATVKYPEHDLGKTFEFNWDKGVQNYTENGITYINLR